jgi:hypothetical protein
MWFYLKEMIANHVQPPTTLANLMHFITTNHNNRCAGCYEEYQAAKEVYSPKLFIEVHKKITTTKQWRDMYNSCKILDTLTRKKYFSRGNEKIFFSRAPIYFPTKICKIQQYYPAVFSSGRGGPCESDCIFFYYTPSLNNRQLSR